MPRTEKNYSTEKNIFIVGTPYREGYEVRTTVALEYGIDIYDDPRTIVETAQAANYEDACDIYQANVKQCKQEINRGQMDQALVEVFGLRNGARYSLWSLRITAI